MLCTIDDVKLLLGITTTTHDNLLDQLIVGASAFIENYTNRNFDIQNFVEVLDGTGTARLPVGHGDITEVISVVDVYGNNYSPSFQGNILYFTDGRVFARGVMNYSVTYKGGFNTVPDDVKWACVDLVAYKFKERERIGEMSVNIAGQVVSYERRDIRDHVRSVLAPYIRVT